MSGGHYDYIYCRMNDLVCSIREDCAKSGTVDPGGWTCHEIPDDIQAHMEWVADRIDELSEAAHDIEWLMSGDYGDDTIRERCKSWKLTEHLRA